MISSSAEGLTGFTGFSSPAEDLNNLFSLSGVDVLTGPITYQINDLRNEFSSLYPNKRGVIEKRFVQPHWIASLFFVVDWSVVELSGTEWADQLI